MKLFDEFLFWSRIICTPVTVSGYTTGRVW